MTRHGKNATAGAVYSYHERKKDTLEGNYGTQTATINRDSARNFDCCCLTLAPCKDPVSTPEGYVYEREAILTNLLTQKRKIGKAEKAYNKQVAKEKEGVKDESKIEQFLANQAPSSAFSKASSSKATPEQKLNNFWVPNQQGNVEGLKLKKPDTKTYCPISNKALRLKDLITIKFTPMPQDDPTKSVICQDVRYMCAVTHDALSNASPCVLIKPSGAVVTLDCYEKLIKKDMVDPTTGTALVDKDMIILKRGSTGYIGAKCTGEGLIAKHKGAVLMS